VATTPGGPDNRMVPAAALPPVAVRPATIDDLDGLIDLLWSVAAEGRWIGIEVPFDRAARRTRLADALARDDATILVAEAAPPDREAEVVGNVAIVIAPYGVADLSMLLDRAWRGRGLGTALLDAGLAWAHSSGAHKVALEVWPHNEAALALYRRAGFVEEGRRRRHYRRANGELWDAVLMGRALS
jgi:RimJ/RimL family protein N-acetyltransferase